MSERNHHGIENARRMMDQGKQIDKLKTASRNAGSKFGGVGPSVSPKTAFAVDSKVDIDALPQTLVNQIKQGKTRRPGNHTRSN
jgi:hypothetical protein